jgi:hypothetical protein
MDGLVRQVHTVNLETSIMIERSIVLSKKNGVFDTKFNLLYTTRYVLLMSKTAS